MYSHRYRVLLPKVLPVAKGERSLKASWMCVKFQEHLQVDEYVGSFHSIYDVIAPYRKAVSLSPDRSRRSLRDDATQKLSLYGGGN